VGLLYRLFSYLVLGALMPMLWLHPKVRRGQRRRFGWYPARPWPSARAVSAGPGGVSVDPRGAGAGPRIWLHGASAGDLNALAPIIAELRRRLPEATLIVSTMTNSGLVAAARLEKDVDGVTYVPWDLPGATRRAVAAIQPDLLVLEYAEIWPNLISAVHARGGRVAVTNGRFSERLIGRYQALYRTLGNPLLLVDLLLMREEVEAERARLLGAPKERVVVTGNTKFDNLAKAPRPEVVAALSAALGSDDAPVFVAGSTHDGEERDVIRAFRGMREVCPELRMIVAPRYTERGPKVLALVEAEGLVGALKSEIAAGRRPPGGMDVLVLDTIGELVAAYQRATLVFVGGSFVTRGGQNILEPAGIGRPVLFGPYMMNFRDSVEVLLGRGGIQVQSPEQLEQLARELLAKPEECARLGAMAQAAVQKVSGASARNAEALVELVQRGH
jgi:3-deoxy-D-manno-octulosonic-acid transferase